MTEKNYAHLAPSYVADTIRAHFPTLGINGNDAIAPLRRGKSNDDSQTPTRRTITKLRIISPRSGSPPL